MIPISDDNPTMRLPIVTLLLLAALGAVWFLVQGAGLDPAILAVSVCDLGLVPGELTLQAAVGTSVPLGPHLACVVDREAINVWTPFTSMFLHGSWGHILGNALFLWIFGNNVEDSMGRVRFVFFYALCGLAAAAAQVAMDPGSPVPMVGASGAISGVMGAYLMLYPRARVNMLFIFFVFFKVFPIPAWVVLVWWFGLQVLSGLPGLLQSTGGLHTGIAFGAHVGGFVAGMALIYFFKRDDYVEYHRTHRRQRVNT